MRKVHVKAIWPDRQNLPKCEVCGRAEGVVHWAILSHDGPGMNAAYLCGWCSVVWAVRVATIGFRVDQQRTQAEDIEAMLSWMHIREGNDLD